MVNIILKVELNLSCLCLLSTMFQQISNRWKLQSVEQQQKEVEAKKKAKEEAKAVAGVVYLTWFKLTF